MFLLLTIPQSEIKDFLQPPLHKGAFGARIATYFVGEGQCPSRRFWVQNRIAAGNPEIPLGCGRGSAPPLQKIAIFLSLRNHRSWGKQQFFF